MVEVDGRRKKEGTVRPSVSSYTMLKRFSLITCYNFASYYTQIYFPHQAPGLSPRAHSSEGQAVIQKEVPKLT